MAHSDGGPLHIPPGAPTTLTEAFLETARLQPDKGVTFVLADGSTVRKTYAVLLEEARSILTGLRANGLKPGDRVILQVGTLADHFSAFWACVLGGATPVTVAVAPSYHELNAVLNKLFNTWELLQHPVILTSDRLLDDVAGLEGLLGMRGLQAWSVDRMKRHAPAEAIHASRPTDLVFFQLTSGSTGIPKCIQETHRGIISHIHASQQFNGYTADDVTVNWLPMDHVVPILTVHLKDVYLGCDQVHAVPGWVLADPLHWLDLLETHRATLTWAPNFGFKLVSDAIDKAPGRKWDLSKVRYFMNAGEQVTVPVVRDFLARVAPFGVRARAMQPSFGMAEACTCMTYQNDFDLPAGVHRFRKASLGGLLQPADRDDASAIQFVDLGPPVPGVQIRITDSSNRLVPEGTIGRFQIKGDVITPGYLNNDTANREAFVGDGWFNSGDLGFILDGRLTLTGREKEMIIVRGANFYCYEIEDVVNALEGVEPTFVAACAVDDVSKGTEGLAIFFVPTPAAVGSLPPLVKKIRAQVTANLGISPAYVIPVRKEEFPKTTSGKIQRTQLKKALLAGQYRDTLKRLDVLLGNANTVPSWFFRKVWRPKQLAEPVAPLPDGCSVIFCDRLGLGTALGAELERSVGPAVTVEPGTDFARLGPRHYSLRPDQPADYDRLLAELAGQGEKVRRVLHLWTYAPYAGEARDLHELEHARGPGVYSFLFCCQALARSRATWSRVQLLAVSSHAQPARREDRVACDRTLIAGLVKAVNQEMPQLDCRHVDLLPGPANAGAQLLLRELQSSRDAEVAYRDGRRLVARLEPVDPSALPKQPLPFAEGGLYLLSGGLGGIGVEVATYLLKHHRARLLLVGRSPLSDERAGAYQALRQLGEVRYEAVDVADVAGLRRVVEAAEAHWQRPLAGVIHLAGTYRDRLLADETCASLAEALRAKAEGAWALHQVLKARPGALFLGFSSVLSTFGGAMTGAYTAANRFLEALCHDQRAAGMRSYCYSWSTWNEVGMSRGYQNKGPLRAKGVQDVAADQGLNSLRAGLAAGQPELFIGLDVANSNVRRHLEADTHRLKRLTAYYTAAAEVARAGLEVRDRFGVHSDCEFSRVVQMPRTAAGAIDRERLADAARRARRGEPERLAPRTEGERRIAAIWQELLGVPQVGVHDNFFELGGHSLLATKVVSRLRDAFGVDVSLQGLFEAPTVAALAKHLETVFRSDDGVQAPPLVPVPRGEGLPLSFAQQRLWFFDQLSPGSPVYNIPSAVRLCGPLDRAALEMALETILRRHEALRTNLVTVEGQPVQVVASPPAVQVPVVDLGGLPAAEQEVRAATLAAEDARLPFDLARDLMLRPCLLRLGAEDHILVMTTHHVASDGWSNGILFRELAAAYEAFAAGKGPDLPPLPIQYPDYAVWQRQWLQGEVLRREVEYWQGQLAGAPHRLELPTDRPRPLVQRFHGAVERVSLSRPLADSVRTLSRQEETTLFMTLLAAFQTLLSTYAGQDDVCVGSPIAGRTRTETEDLIGFFANTLVLRTQLSGDPDFRELLRRVRETALGAYAHQDLPFEKVVEAVRPPRDPSRNPIFQANFRVQNAPPAHLQLPGLACSPLEIDPGIARFDLALDLWVTPDGLGGYLEYSTDLFARATIVQLAADFEKLLGALVAQPETPLSRLEVLTELRQRAQAANGNGAASAAKSFRNARRKAIDLGAVPGEEVARGE
jgi:acyl-CoA synthetase (AMP-forming)/AMP-acid ligase II